MSNGCWVCDGSKEYSLSPYKAKGLCKYHYDISVNGFNNIQKRWIDLLYERGSVGAKMDKKYEKEFCINGWVTTNKNHVSFITDLGIRVKKELFSWEHKKRKQKNK